MRDPGGRRGLTAIEVLVVLAVLIVFALGMLMMLPRRLETARRASCQGNLMQIGAALALYDQETGSLPTIAPLANSSGRAGDGPLKRLLGELGLPDLRGLADPRASPARRPGIEVTERPVAGFLCPSDPNATSGLFPAPVSYRANAGDDPAGRTGVFAPGQRVRLSAIEAGDGTSFTVAFAERLVGTGGASPSLSNYAQVPAPVLERGCRPAELQTWHGDAGSSWAVAGWRTTLYTHALAPNAAPSCIADDGLSAYLGASSGHAFGVHVLNCDGSVRGVSPGVDPRVWRAMATPGVPASRPVPKLESSDSATGPKPD